MRGLHVARALAAALLALPVTTSLDVFVDPRADEAAGDGSRAAPLATLPAARDAVRALLAAEPHPADDIVVHVAPGTYRVREALRLNASDCARDGRRRVRWVADGKAPAVVSGATPVLGWAEAGGAGGNAALLHAALPAALAGRRPRHLFVGEARAYRTVDAPNATVAGLAASVGANVTAFGITTPSAAPLHWPNPAAVELLHNAAFQQSRCAVRAVRPRGDGGADVVMAQPCWSLGVATGQMAFPSAVLHIGGASAARLPPGAWHLTQDHTVVYHPRSAAERTLLLNGGIEAAMPVATGLIDAVGVSALDIVGLQFERTAWEDASSDDGYLERYGGVRFLLCNSTKAKETGTCYASAGDACAAGCCGAAGALGGCALRMAEPAVHIAESRDVTITGCDFRQTGAWGLGLTRGTSYSTVSRNRFSDTSGGGVYLGNVNETRSNSSMPRPTALSVTDNTVVNTGGEYQGSSGIHLFSAVDSTIAHNHLHHIPYTAFVTFVWPVPRK